MRKILLATDDSPHANEATWFLAHLPHEDKVEITVLSVLYVPTAGSMTLLGDWVQIILERERERAVATFAKVESRFDGANVTLKHIIKEGHVAETIVDVANRERVDFVVLGARGHSLVERIVLGSTSDYVATHATCSVLVVRPTEIREANHPIRIAIAYEDSEAAEAALQEIAEVGWGAEPDLRVVTVLFSGGFEESARRNLAESTALKAAEWLRKTASHVHVESIVHSHIGEGLVSYLEENRCDIVVVGETPRTRLGRVLMGSTSRFVLRHAPCSVWITRNRIMQGKPSGKTHPETASL
ncbi:universal stress protein UspE [Novipirellula galeiformis]|uniref:Universal stress protein UspE n=1 Tax=Novipirellula galeiformis TaxID=2528004 RepID=A0A5C6CBW1_9BACT|nr:universal stress protein [Novipirellula galeiformis]TWU22263.1 universal stress protein UspE [Novipirellula galeiformis]